MRASFAVGSLGKSTSSTATVVQTTVKDPATGNRYDTFLTSSASTTSPTTAIGQAGYISGNVAGNALLCFAGCANDFGTGPNPAGNKVIACSDSVNGSWADVGEQLNNTNDCNFDARVWVKFNAQPLLSTSWSGTASCSGGVLTLTSAGSGAFRLFQRINSAGTPAPTIAGGEVLVVSLLSGSLGANGSTYQLNGSGAGLSFASQALTTTDVVLIQRSQTVSSNFADYPGTILWEVSGTDNSSAFFVGANPVPSGNATDSVSTGTVAMGSVPGLILAWGFNGGVNEGAGGTFAPNAGTGFGGQQKILTYDQGQNIATLESAHFASLGTRAATFTPVTNTTSNYLALMVGLLDHP